MKIVAVSQRVDNYPDRNERRDALHQRLSQWLVEAGYVPVPVPNLLEGPSVTARGGLQGWLDAVQPQAVLLSGGNDIGEAPERDFSERQLLTYAERQGLPVLGICRGLQMMGVQAGAHLKELKGHVRTRHALLGEIAGEVNSYHNYSLADCPGGYLVIARSEDGEIEAIRHKTLPWESWMWHPEREESFHARDIQRLKALFGE